MVDSSEHNVPDYCQKAEVKLFIDNEEIKDMLDDFKIECNVIDETCDSKILVPTEDIIKKSVKRINVPYKGKKIKVLMHSSEIEIANIKKVIWKNNNDKVIKEDKRIS